MLSSALLLALAACDGESGPTTAQSQAGNEIIPLPRDFDQVTEIGNAPPPPVAAIDSIEARVEAEIFTEINNARIQRGLQPLRLDSRLTLIELEHNRDMGLAGRNGGSNLGISHDGFNQRSQTVFSFGFTTVGENVAALGNLQPAVLSDNFVRNWLNSPAHLRNIVAPGVTTTGVSVYIDPVTRLIYASQLFAG